MEKTSKPFAIIIRRNTFEKYLLDEKQNKEIWTIGREDALEMLMNHLNNEIIVSTTGKLSRELFEYRKKNNMKIEHDFYNIGAMGCAQSIALGIALQKKDRKVFVFDGDGSVLMQMGGLATIGHYLPKNFYHIIFDNEAHDSICCASFLDSTTGNILNVSVEK